MVPWGPKAHLVEAFKFAVYLAVPVTLTVAVAQNDRNLFGLIDHFQYIKVRRPTRAPRWRKRRAQVPAGRDVVSFSLVVLHMP